MIGSGWPDAHHQSEQLAADQSEGMHGCRRSSLLVVVVVVLAGHPLPG
jgi:hypothetical protein